MTSHSAGGHSAAGNADNASAASLGDLVGRLTQDLSTLLRQEIALAKAEARQTAQKAGAGIGLLVGALIAAQFVLLFLSAALWYGLGTQIGFGWSAIIVAVIWAVVALVLAMVGRGKLKQAQGLPETASTVKEIPEALKGNEGRQ
ncbi:phage holin family protein [Saxibacter everestensis]|uniref:Phage holin family protein n=1 Tax=Saxibacter everestensis TaxID=2909229 RepID=A0ABY8QTX7_9MICO|nr:phage holin family protein [Brevibacteriaceae bacterium ZFBP1038]